jgi:hypothetical protein
VARELRENIVSVGKLVDHTKGKDGSIVVNSLSIRGFSLV